jgi:hypothetical protein
MKRSFIDKEIEQITLDESGILGFQVINNEQDMVFFIDWCGQANMSSDIDFNSITSKLIFEFVTDLEVNFRFFSGMGALEITGFTFAETNGIWSVEFIFSFEPKGIIKFKCNRIEFSIEASENKERVS